MKKLLSVILAALIILSSVPASAHCKGPHGPITPTTGDVIKK